MVGWLEKIESVRWKVKGERNSHPILTLHTHTHTQTRTLFGWMVKWLDG
jgi:hypothetical protein